MSRATNGSNPKDQHRDHLISDASSESKFHSVIFGQKHTNSSYFNVPGVFVGFNPRSSESDSERSPTSPLDYKVFSNMGNPLKPRRSSNEVHQKSWDCSKVGLSIIDSLYNESKYSGKVIGSSDSKNILFGPKMRISNANFRGCIDSLEVPRSLPKNVAIFPNDVAKPPNHIKDNSNVLFEIGGAPSEPEQFDKNLHSCSLDSGRLSGNLNSKNAISHMFSESKLGDSSVTKLSSIPASISCGSGFIGSVPAREVELSEDYTCVRTHGPNPKVTHIFGDCILECHDKLADVFEETLEEIPLPQAAECSDVFPSYPSSDFLKFCYSCKKKLEGEDVYMYRGEKAFCSWSCRSQVILIDEEVEKTSNNSSENFVYPNGREESFESSLFISA
ncbi:unnamed protein product [Fraxinus pennsylvanica]|uniref:FLZ-type domain-containing protein n=1 Tax=Fraxinus pennsylvanica TaxID=56036 RepID=A0AAD1YVL6_9LAMI|nr:unnamed protein product [Fraxinus pennsylvanica]